MQLVCRAASKARFRWLGFWLLAYSREEDILSSQLSFLSSISLLFVCFFPYFSSKYNYSEFESMLALISPLFTHFPYHDTHIFALWVSSLFGKKI